jgi:hypothetical protein
MADRTAATASASRPPAIATWWSFSVMVASKPVMVIAGGYASSVTEGLTGARTSRCGGCSQKPRPALAARLVAWLSSVTTSASSFSRMAFEEFRPRTPDGRIRAGHPFPRITGSMWRKCYSSRGSRDRAAARYSVKMGTGSVPVQLHHHRCLVVGPSRTTVMIVICTPLQCLNFL